MTIDKELNQAIIYHKKMASIYKRNHNDSEGNAELKLVGWLEELKRLRGLVKDLPILVEELVKRGGGDERTD